MATSMNSVTKAIPPEPSSLPDEGWGRPTAVVGDWLVEGVTVDDASLGTVSGMAEEVVLSGASSALQY